jgi:Concanavalin A-like lectin/glucanases superfamily
MALAQGRRTIGLLAVVAAAAGCGASPLDAVTVNPHSLAMGLVAHWTFDEGSGSVVGDSSGNGLDGALTGGTWTTDGQFGGALTLALGDYVTVPNFPQATSNWTVSVWTETSRGQLQADTSDTATILSTEVVFAGGWQLHLDNRSGYHQYDAAYWAGSTANDYEVLFCHCIDENRWIHLTAVFDDDAGTFTVYQDGLVVDQKQLPTSILPGDSTLFMGTWNMGERFLAATLDDFAIWNRALDEGEVAILSQQPPGH